MVRYQPASHRKRGRNIGSSRFQVPDLCTGGTTSGLSTIAPKTSKRDSEKTDKTNRASRPLTPNLPEVAETTQKAPGSGSALGDRREPANPTHLPRLLRLGEWHDHIQRRAVWEGAARSQDTWACQSHETLGQWAVVVNRPPDEGNSVRAPQTTRRFRRGAQRRRRDPQGSARAISWGWSQRIVDRLQMMCRPAAQRNRRAQRQLRANVPLPKPSARPFQGRDRHRA